MEPHFLYKNKCGTKCDSKEFFLAFNHKIEPN